LGLLGRTFAQASQSYFSASFTKQVLMKQLLQSYFLTPLTGTVSHVKLGEAENTNGYLYYLVELLYVTEAEKKIYFTNKTELYQTCPMYVF
jgi:hypothetical protein